MAQGRDPVVVCSVMARGGVEAARRAVLGAPAGCGLVELRADCMTPDEVAEVVRAIERPLLVTARRTADGGGFTGSEEERGRVLLAALRSGAALVDVESGSPAADLVRGRDAARVVLSHHGGACRLPELRRAYERLSGRGAGRLKLVPRAAAVGDVTAIRDLLAEVGTAGPPLACFAEGRAGALSRVLAPAWGSWATYGAAARGAETAEGQLTAAELLELHDVLHIGPTTRVFALVGTTVRDSPSPAMHTAAYRARGIDARYVALEADEIGELLALLGRTGDHPLAGLAVTLPFKESVAQRVTLDDEIARVARAVNTVVAAGPGLRGFNTDGPAVVNLLGRHRALRGACVAVAGAGGTGRAIVVALRAAGAAVTLYNRSASRADAVARDVGGIAVAPWDDLRRAAWDVLVQATPLGAQGERVPVELRPGAVVLDVIYGPQPTPLVAEARAAGLAVVDGFEVLLAQAVLQFARLTGVAADRPAMERAGRDWLRRQAAAAAP